MGKKLGIYVTSDEHMEKLIKLCKAAKKKDVEVTVFLAKVALCKVGFESLKLKKPGDILDEKAYSSQSFHAEMILDCDQYLSF